ncbi:MAG: hypothetical protein WBF79_08920 [Rhodococcus sp. (in: high G+C Gram-positive bacteria)]
MTKTSSNLSLPNSASTPAMNLVPGKHFPLSIRETVAGSTPILAASWPSVVMFA